VTQVCGFLLKEPYIRLKCTPFELGRSRGFMYVARCYTSSRSNRCTGAPVLSGRGSLVRRAGLGDVSTIQSQIAAMANQYGIPPSIALAVAQIESGFNQSAVNAGGDTGVMQISPPTAVTLGIDPTDLTQNIQGGVSYLAQLYATFGNWSTALAAYNCGPGNPQGCTGYASTVLAAQPAYTSFDAAAAPASSDGSASLLDTADSSGSDITPWLLLGAAGLVALYMAL
jgi:soluble lytic murein transglycosylase-like protein